MLVVVSGGNSGLDTDIMDVYPMSYAKENEAMLAVVAVDSNDDLAKFSNRGSIVVRLWVELVGVYDSLGCMERITGVVVR